MSGLTTVFRKEVHENIRDRRALFNSLLLGPLLFPLLFVGLMLFLQSAEKERQEQVLELPVVGAEHAPSLVRFLEQQGTLIQPEPDDPEGMVRKQEVQVILRILPEYPEQWRQGLPAPVEVISDPSRQESNAAIRKLKGMLSVYGRQTAALRLQLRGVSPQLAAPVMVRDVDLSTPKSRAIGGRRRRMAAKVSGGTRKAAPRTTRKTPAKAGGRFLVGSVRSVAAASRARRSATSTIPLSSTSPGHGWMSPA